MKIPGREFGNKGETAAKDYLVAKGYTIEALKWRKSRFEIDIVASKKNLLVFVEVKTSRASSLGPPELRVDKNKQQRIGQAASEYIADLKEIPENIRFDVIGILWQSGPKPKITHMESAFILDDDV